MYLKTAIYATLQLLFVINLVNCSIDSTTQSITEDASKFETRVLNLLPSAVRERARSYIASRLRRVVLIPPFHPISIRNVENPQSSPPPNVIPPSANFALDLTTLIRSRDSGKKLYNPHGRRMLGSNLVPIIPKGVATPKWVPGELIASQISKREIQIINESVFGPLKSVTIFPSLMTSILVFNQRYNPERLAQILKFNYGIEAVPNGVIVEI